MVVSLRCHTAFSFGRWVKKVISSNIAPEQIIRTVVSQPVSIFLALNKYCPMVPENPQQMPANTAKMMPRVSFFFICL